MTEKRRGRPATGQTTVTIRIPLVLKPAVEELVATYRRVKWMPSRPLVQAPDGLTDDALSREADLRVNADKRTALLELLRARQVATVDRLTEELADAERELSDTECRIAGL